MSTHVRSATSRPLVEARWESADRHAKLLRWVLAGGVLAVVLAIVGLPPISIHEPAHFLGIMGPSCGLTRASVFLARGELGEAWRYNPGSFVLAAIAGFIVARGMVGRLCGRWLEITFRHPRLLRVVVGAGVVLLWVNQQRHAALLR